MEVLCQDRIPDGPLEPGVVAYLDFRRFGVLPHPGGTFAQPHGLMEDLRYVSDQVQAAENRRAQAQAKQGR